MDILIGLIIGTSGSVWGGMRLYTMDTLLAEDFESGYASGWTIVDGNNDGYTFSVSSCSSIPLPPNNCNTYALYYSDIGASNPSHDTVISPDIDISIYMPINLAHLSYSYSFSTSSTVGDSLLVFISGFDGTTWQPPTLADIVSPVGDTLGATRTVDITNLISSFQQIRIYFVHKDHGNTNGGVAIDNIYLFIDFQFPNDLGVVGPYYIPPQFYTFYPSGSGPSWPLDASLCGAVINYGTNTMSNIALDLYIDGNFYQTSNSSIPVAPSGFVDSLCFDQVPIGNEVVQFMLVHTLSPDDFPFNDTLRFTIDHSVYYRVGDTVHYTTRLVDSVGYLFDTSTTFNSPGRIAIRFDSLDLFPFVGKYIKSIFFYHCHIGGTCNSGGNDAVAIYPDNNGFPDHTNALYRKQIGSVGTSPGLIFVETEPASVSDLAALRIDDRDFPFYVAREVQVVGNGLIFGKEPGCTPDKGCWMSIDALNGGAWFQLTDYYFDMNWILGIVVADNITGSKEHVVIPGDSKLVIGMDGEYIVFSSPAESDFTISIYTTSGRLLKTVQIRKGMARAYTGKLPAGTYFYLTDDGHKGALVVR